MSLKFGIKGKMLVVFCTLFSIFNDVEAQVVVTLPTSGAATSVAAGETALIYDNGGALANYNNGVSGYVYLTASPGQTITISGSYDTELGWDYFKIISGNGTGGAVLSNVSGTANWFTYTGAAGVGLTVQLTADGTVNLTGLKLLATYSTLATATFGTTGNGSNACGTNKLVFDNGGRAGQYSNNVSYYYVFNGGGAAVIRLLGTYFTQAGNDPINIYNGVGTAGTLLATFSGNMNVNTAGTVIDYTGTAGQTLTVQFVSNNATFRDGFEIAAIYSGPCVLTACSGAPTGGTSASSVSSACSGVNFTLTNTGQSTGTGITYVWQSGPSSTGPWTSIGTASSTYTALTTNQSSLNYYRLFTTCTNSSTGTGSTPVLVGLGGNCTCLPYTIIVPASTADEDIGNVTVGTLNNTTTCANTGTGPASSLNLFSNYAGSIAAPTLQQGSSISFSLTSITCGGNYGNGFQIYIDWNQNGNFNDAGEQMYSTGSNIVGPHTETGTFTVPLSATVGSTRMRVICVETTFPVATNYASTGYLWGETEDYCVNVTVAPPCAGTPTSTAVASVSTMCSGNTSVLSLTGLSGTGISYQWQSGTTATGPWTTITGATSATYTTPALTSTSYYRCNVTCSGSGITNPSSVVTVTVTPAPAGATISNPIFAGVIDCVGYSNTMSNAAGACIGNDLTVGTNQASDDIFYFFNLSNANNFNTILNVSHCGSGFDTYIHLLNSAGALISENDDNGPVCTGTASSIQSTLSPGFYYVVSEGYAANTGSINTQIQIAPMTGTGAISGLTSVCLPSTTTYTLSGLTNVAGAIWTVPAGVTLVSGQGTTSISVSFPVGASSGTITCVPYNGPCAGTTLTLNYTTSSPVGNPAVSPSGQWNVYAYNAGDATGGSGAWTTNYAGYYSISNLSFDTQTGQTNSTAQSWVNSASPSSAAGYQGCAVQVDNHSYIFKRTGVPTCGTYRIDALNHDDMAILYINGAEVWRHNGCCDVHNGVWTGYLDANSTLEYRVSEGGGGSNAGLAFTQIATTATLTGTNPPSCLVNGSITISSVTGGACNLLSTGFGSLPSSTAVSGSAAITGEECVITTAANSLVGAWGYTPLIRPDAFGLTYNQFIGTGTGADGMSFSYGPFAYNTGGSETGWNTGLVVSFDTYNNPTGTTSSRIYLSYNGVEFASNTLGSFNLRTGSYIPVSINVNQAGQLTLIVNGTTIFNNTAVPAAYLSANKSTWNFAFSARTGGLNDAHKVDNVNLYADNYFEYSINGTTWQTSTIFSAPVGTYTVQARPICGTSCATTLGTVTLSSATLDWANTQYPASGEICQGSAFDVYGQVYEPGVTPGAGAQGPGITAQVGVFTSNTNPSTWPSSAWSSANFNSGGGGANNDEYMANIGSTLSAGTYYYAFRYSLGGCAYQYGGYSASGGGFWDGSNYVNGQLIVRQVVPVVTVTSPILCNGGTATLNVTGSGGVAPYTGETTATVAAGTYTYTLTDSNGCIGTTSYTVTEPAVLSASSSATSISCNGGSATVTVIASGGTAPYTGTGSYTVTAGTFTYTVTDANGCSATTSITLTEPTTLVSSASVDGTIYCYGGATTVTVTATGGTGAYVGTGTFSALAGSSTYTVTDANGCSSSSSVTITQPADIVITATNTPISCTGGSSVVTITATGGTGTLFGTGSFVVGAGTYYYTVTDSYGCYSTETVVVNQPTVLTASANATAIACYGGTSTVTVNATGGTAPYTGTGTYSVGAGTYTYTVTDANGCSASASVTITQPSQLAAASTSTPILCNGGNSTITVTATGGTTPYGGIGTYTVTAGTHSYTVTDTNGCTATTSITVTEPTALTASSTSTSISCNGGSATVTVSGNGGTAPYTGTGTFTANAGTHSYTVTDANGCTATTSITVTEPTALTASSTSTSISCNGGSATVTVSGNGGTAPYTGTGTYTVTAGTYSYTVTDANGCTATTSITVTQPTVLTASSTSTSISCNGGSATVTVSGNGGTAPYTGTGTYTVTAGTYSYTVTDANGCTATTSITVTEPTALTASSSSTSISCNGGSATVTVSGNGGTAPFTGTGTYTVTAGTYSYTVTDANGCTATTSITVTEPTALTASSSSTSISCNGGSATVTVSGNGGTAPYTGTGAYTVTAGTYSYTVIDANGCTATTSITVTEPTALTASSTSTSISCNGGSATVTVSGNGGTAPYTGTGTYTVTAGTYSYTVTDANGCTATTSITVTQPTVLTASSTSTSISCNGGSATVTVSGNGGTAPYTGTGTYTVTAGTYSYTVTDANGCTATTSITVTEPTALTASSTSTSISCNGGSATVTVSGNGGTAPYTGTGTYTVTAGTYSYTVTDANGCTATTSITVTEPTALTASSSSTSISCNGGSATVTVSGNGGTAPYTGTGTYTVTAGTYSYTVTDANGCTATTSITVTEPTALTASSSSTSISCNGGSATVTVSGNGGTAPYTGTGAYTVTAGTYSYTVIDANGCTATTSITVTEPTALTASSSSTSISCNGGSATVTVSGNGGTAPYTGTGAYTVTAGTYSYTVIDANGCTATTSITVTEPTALTASSTSTSISCNGGSATVTVSGNGGTAPYTGTGTYTVTAGTYSYTVTDANGCTATTSITVTQPTVLTASSTSTSISCNGGSATVTVSGNGGTAPYTGTGTYTVTAGTYSYTVTDANGCTATTSITVTEPTALTASSTSAGVACFGGTATVVVTGNGGTGPYTGTGSYSVSAGTYSYTISDANGCSASTSIVVSQPTVLTASISNTAILCNGGTSVITVSASGGTGPYTGTGTYTVTAGTHSYTVTDANGCTTTTSTTITEPSALVASSSATSISCYGGTATVTVSATGGTTPYSGIGNYTVSAGTHTYTVTDVNGCTSNTTIVVTEPALVNAPTGTASQTFCSTLNATLASVQVTGTAVQWYASNAGGTPLPTTTTLVNGTTYYATQTIAGCESPSYLAVLVIIPVASTYYADADADGFGNSSVSQLACTQPTGYVLNSTDCNDGVATTYPGAPELCNSVDDNCSGFVDEGCPSTIAGEEPFNAVEAPSTMYSYCSSFYGTLAGAFPSTLAQSTCITGEDRWYSFTTLSTGVTIFVGSNANDIVIELQDANGNVIDVENTVVGIGTEVLTKTGLTLGATYRVGIRNYNSNAQAGGQFSGCIRHLRVGGSDSGTSATWPSTIGMCNVFKAAYCGGTGVQYRYTWTGLTGIAAGQVYTKTQTSDYLTLTSVTPMLPAGCMYNVLVTAIYTIPNGAGVNEVFEMPAVNPTTITISANPLTALRTTDQCSAGPRYRGAVVASLPWVCGVTNWRWRFTEVNPLTLQTVGLPIEQNRGAASNYLTLTSVTALQYGKTYAVQTSPIYTYTGTNYQWGPVTYMCIIGSAGLVVDQTEDATQDSPKDVAQDASQGVAQEFELSVYPNPTNGDALTMSLSGINSDNVQVRIYGALGRKIQSERYVVDGTLQTTLSFKNELSNGLYILEVSTGDVRRSVRFMVEQ